MMRARYLALAALAGTSILALSNACALITCVEDDCARVETGGSSPTSSGTGGSGGAMGVSGSVATGTGTGVGGEGGGGGEPCTKDCVTASCRTEKCQPKCSPLPGAGRDVTTTTDAVFALAEVGAGGGSGDATIQTVLKEAIGAQTMEAVNGTFPATGHLASDGNDVYFASGFGLRNLATEVECMPGWSSVVLAGASSNGRTFWAAGATLHAYQGCGQADDHAAGDALSGVDSVEESGGSQLGYVLKSGTVCSVVFDGTSFQLPSCFSGTFTNARSVAVTPNAKRVLFVADGGVFSGSVGSDDATVTLPLGGDVFEVAATTDWYFVSRSAPDGEGTLLRCPANGSLEDCRSFGASPVSALHGGGDTVYFTMGDELCAWQ